MSIRQLFSIRRKGCCLLDRHAVRGGRREARRRQDLRAAAPARVAGGAAAGRLREGARGLRGPAARRYILQEELGRGGFCVVRAAIDTKEVSSGIQFVRYSCIQVIFSIHPSRDS